jgi:YbbR domain-containing protein
VNARGAIRRAVGVVLHNWPLKVAAIVLASLLYVGLVASQDSNTLQGPITITIDNRPANTVVTNQIRDVDQIRYIAPSGVPRQRTADFQVTVDLSNVQPDGQPATVRVQVTPLDPRVTIVEVRPQNVQVVLDELASKTVPVRVEPGPAPSGIQVGEVTKDPTEVDVTGPSMVVSQVVAARVDVSLDRGNLNVDSEIDALPINDAGDVVTGVNLEPRTVHVTIPLYTNRGSRTLPVNPVVTGDPAPGFRIASITVDPQVVTVEGNGDRLATLTQADTAPIALFGATSDVTEIVAYALPTGVSATGTGTVTVTVRVEAVTETRTYTAGLRLDGSDSGLTYAVSDNQVLMTLYGSVADLDRLSSAPLVVGLNVAGLAPGKHDVPVVPSLPSGVTVASLSPRSVTVTITAPPSPSPTATPGATLSEPPAGTPGQTPSAAP